MKPYSRKITAAIQRRNTRKYCKENVGKLKAEGLILAGELKAGKEFFKDKPCPTPTAQTTTPQASTEESEKSKPSEPMPF